jgi:hypothetical protein
MTPRGQPFQDRCVSVSNPWGTVRRNSDEFELDGRPNPEESSRPQLGPARADIDGMQPHALRPGLSPDAPRHARPLPTPAGALGTLG